ncbi:procathepsin L-like [Planococcus citri]|uniref:procathepsin L-like n=1 Tax=Planococcus citri TaxID=170843 RepID=UPI0031F733C7
MILLLVSLSALINTQIFALTTDLNQQVSGIPKWDIYKVLFNKKYASAVRELERFKIYLGTVEAINQHNELFERNQTTYKKGINEFSDLTSEEFANIYLSWPLDSLPQADLIEETSNSPPPNNNTVPDKIDWVTKGAVAGVRHQGYCACSSSIVAAELIEGYIFKQNGHLMNISAQVFVDCLEQLDCCGGYVHQALDYSIKNGIVTEKSYPFKEMKNMCRPNNTVPKYGEAAIKKYAKVTQNETLLKEIVFTHGPVSCYINATALKDYESGIYDDVKCGQNPPEMNHALLIVGYGTDIKTERDYWLVKNSWGSRWGEKGYVKIARNLNNLCGIANKNLYLMD